MASGAPLNFAAAAQKPATQKKTPLRVVQLEGSVVLKIAKHCKENASATSVVTGQLLGLDVGQTLEVTDCFPFPVRSQPGWEGRSRESASRLAPRPCSLWLLAARAQRLEGLFGTCRGLHICM